MEGLLKIEHANKNVIQRWGGREEKRTERNVFLELFNYPRLPGRPSSLTLVSVKKYTDTKIQIQILGFKGRPVLQSQSHYKQPQSHYKQLSVSLQKTVSLITNNSQSHYKQLRGRTCQKVLLHHQPF